MEMLVVVIIISLVMAIGANTYRNQRKHVEYNNAIDRVSSMIKTARNYAVTAHSVYDSCETGNETHVPEEGYGVYISRTTAPDEYHVVLFANTEKDDEVEVNQYDDFGSSCDQDLIEEEYVIPGDFAHLASLSTDKVTPLAVDEVVILFSPPLADAQILLNDHPASPSALVYLDDLYLEFRRPGTPASVPSHYLYFNRYAGYPENIIE